jgi:hypothetical protein
MVRLIINQKESGLGLGFHFPKKESKKCTKVKAESVLFHARLAPSALLVNIVFVIRSLSSSNLPAWSQRTRFLPIRLQAGAPW